MTERDPMFTIEDHNHYKKTAKMNTVYSCIVLACFLVIAPMIWFLGLGIIGHYVGMMLVMIFWFFVIPKFIPKTRTVKIFETIIVVTFGPSQLIKTSTNRIFHFKKIRSLKYTKSGDLVFWYGLDKFSIPSSEYDEKIIEIHKTVRNRP